jgi:ABC-type branched-subunit amino acid transport system substrate-binding protein
MKSKLVLIVVGVVLVLSGCQYLPRRGPVEVPVGVFHAPPPPAAEELWQKAQEQEKRGDLKGAERTLEEIAEQYTQNAVAARALTRIGEIRFRRGDYDAALDRWERVLNRYPQWNRAGRVEVKRLKALWNSGKHGQVFQEATRLRDTLPKKSPAQIYFCLFMSDVFVERGDKDKAFQWLKAGFSHAQTGDQRQVLTGKTQELLETMSEAELTQLLSRTRWEFMKVFLEYRLAQLKVESGREKEARESLQGLTDRAGEHPLAEDIAIYLEETFPALRLPVDPKNIGCLLPLSGKYAEYGNRVMQGLSLAASEWSRAHPDEPLRLVVRDSRGEPKTARREVQDLVTRENAVAVVGPLNPRCTREIAGLSREWELPVLSLSREPVEGKLAAGVFHPFMSKRAMLDSLLDYCIGTLDYRRLGVLYPEDRHGSTMAGTFTDLVEKMQGTVAGKAGYQPDLTDFKEPIARLLELDPAVLSRDRKKRDSFDVPFDAVFIPDGAQTVALLAPQLPYYDLVGVTLLGTNLWADPKLISMGGAYVEGAIFPTPFFADSPSERVREFVEAYRDAYASKPGYLAAQAYDAMTLLLRARAGLTGDPVSRRELVEVLAGTVDFDGVTGTHDLSPEGDMQREFFILQVSSGQLRQLRPEPPESSGMTPFPGQEADSGAQAETEQTGTGGSGAADRPARATGGTRAPEDGG